MNLVHLGLALAGLYLGIGILFALAFVLAGVQRVDPQAAHGTWGFRLLLLPGATFLWPLLAQRWFRGRCEPPVEHTAHRRPRPHPESSVQNPKSSRP